MSTITFDGNTLLCRTPYLPDLVADLKSRIPASDRQWDGQKKAWRIAPQHGDLLVQMIQYHLGERITAPNVPQALNKETRLLEIKYLGRTKDRGADDRSAFAWCDGGWSVCIPEFVLRDWFDAPCRPDEELSLYQTLAVKSNASPSDIKQAYRRLSRQWHPDVCREPGAAEVFIAIKRAYDLLSDPQKRARYDAGLKLTATLGIQTVATDTSTGIQTVATDASPGYRAPLRCGLLLCEGTPTLKFVVEKILAWEDITNEYGQTLSVSWPLGAKTFQETWI